MKPIFNLSLVRSFLLTTAAITALNAPGLSQTSELDIPKKVEIPKEVIGQSWKKGSETMKSLDIHLLLSSRNKKFQKVVVGDSGKKYRLKVYHNPYFNLPQEHWEVELKEDLSITKSKTILSKTLFWDWENNPNYDVYMGTKQQLIGVLYPEDNILVINGENEPLYGFGQGFYHHSTVRKINIESFCITLRVGEQRVNRKNEDKMDLFEVFISFGPTCK